MKVHVVGSGGREAALRHVLARTADVVDTVEGSDLVVIGPEAPLSAGMADQLRGEGYTVFGPGADGAMLEGSKAWMKELLVEAGIPTAAHRSFAAGDVAGATRFLETLEGGYVVKTDYLAEGKGVLVTDAFDEARRDLEVKLSRGGVVIEERMTGPEVSLLCVCDGRKAVPLASARDYKRVLDGDEGPNTGGMGAFSPVPGVDGDALVDDIVQPTLDALRARGIDYRGILYAGLMLTPSGPKIIEFNVRFGDPECQVVAPRYDGDFAQLLLEAAQGELVSTPAFVDDAAVTVVVATGGYPVKPYDTGHVMAGYDEMRRQLDHAVVFEYAVGRDEEGAPIADGGRVFCVTGFGPTLASARSRAYEAVRTVDFPGMHYRIDIATDEE